VGKALMGVKDMISARLKKPDGFKGHPLFADDRSVDPMIDPVCQIRADLSDASLLTYNLLVTDFTRCGVLRRNVSRMPQAIGISGFDNVSFLSAGFRARASVVSAVPRRGNDVRPRADHNV